LPAGPYYKPHLVRIRQYKSRGEIHAYFRDLPAQQRAELFRSLDASSSKRSWLRMTDADQQKAYRRFRNFDPESPFARQKSMDFVNAGRAMQKRGKSATAGRTFLGEDSGLTVLSSLATVTDFVVGRVREWKKEKKEGEKNGLEERIRELEEEIEALRKRLQDVEREGKGAVVGVTDEDVTAWLEDTTEDDIDYEDNDYDQYEGRYKNAAGWEESQRRYRPPHM
jgi:hypothetical protein